MTEEKTSPETAPGGAAKPAKTAQSRSRAQKPPARKSAAAKAAKPDEAREETPPVSEPKEAGKPAAAKAKPAKAKSQIKRGESARSRGLGFAILLALIALIVSLYAWPYLLPRIAKILPFEMAALPDAAERAARDARQSEQIGDIVGFYDLLSGRFDGLAAREGQNAGRLADLTARLETAEGRLQEMEAELRGLRSLDTLEARIAALEDSAPADPALVLVALAASRLRLDATAGRSLVEDLASLRMLLARWSAPHPELDAALAALEPHAAGAPSLARLKANFGAALSGALRAGASGDEESWWRRILSRLAALVSVRKTGQEGGGLDARLARAEAALDADDLEAALAELESIDGAPGAALAPWIGDAKARLAVDGAAAALEATALKGLVVASKAPGGAARDR